MANKPVILCIMDGFGIREEFTGNAVAAAHTPNLDALLTRWPAAYLSASGEDVGLPAGQMGNSEVGHLNIGAGRVVYQDLTRITKAVADGDFFANPELLRACRRGCEPGRALHLIGLLSDGGVHSHIDHMKAMCDMAKRNGVVRLYLHLFTDGRDVSPTSGEDFVREIAAFLSELNLGAIATLAGRYYAMDRDKRWARTEVAYRAMTAAPTHIADPLSVMADSYAEGITDEFVKPVATCEGGRIAPGDAVITMNFRPDRMRQMTHAFTDPDFDGFEREQLDDLLVVNLTEYEAGMPGVTVAFGPMDIANTLGDVIEAAGLSQLRVAETEKYAHVTFFFDGGSEVTRPHEERILLPSPGVATYDLCPEMRAQAITDAVLTNIDSYDFILLNYANPDMVGHTGVFEAAVSAVETVDREVGRLAEAVLAQGGVLCVTADHGNAEEMLSEDGPMTAHTTNPVPFCLVGCEKQVEKRGILADIAPTILQLLGLTKPADMCASSLLKP